MSHKGFSHIGLSTLDLDKTREFYEGVLGFKPVRCDTITVKEGGKIRHIFFDTGRDELIAFMEAKGIDVSEVVDHDWAKSIYFKDPNGMQLEYCCLTREFSDNDLLMQDRFSLSINALGLEDVSRMRSQ